MFLISLPLLVILVVGLACGWLNLVPGIIGACVLLLLDILATLNQINESNDKKSHVSLDSTEIFNKAEQRNNDLADRYVEVLMREKELKQEN